MALTGRGRGQISPLFGRIAVKLGLSTPEAVAEALRTQEEIRSVGGTPPLLGRILVESGALNPEGVRRILEEVEKRSLVPEIPGVVDLSPALQGDRVLVYRGRLREDGRTVSIRVLRFGLADSEEEVDRFLDEIRTLSRLHHPNVVRVLGAGDIEGIPYVIEEHVLGPTLKLLLEEHGALPEERSLRIAREITAGLEHAHSLDIVHGALRPESILVPRLSGARVTDFCLLGCDAAGFDPGHPGFDALLYLAPEQFQRHGHPSVRSDIYAVGAVLFHMLTGRPPFRGGYREVLRQLLRRPAPDPKVLAPSISEASALLVRRLLAKDPGARPESMGALAGELAAVENDRAREAPLRPEGSSLPDRLRPRRRASRLRD